MFGLRKALRKIVKSRNLAEINAEKTLKYFRIISRNIPHYSTKIMDIQIIIIGIVALLLLMYLFAVMVRPENF